jgi:hypothetical protein
MAIDLAVVSLTEQERWTLASGMLVMLERIIP